MARPPEEQVYLESRRHGIVLMGPLLRALALALAGIACLILLSWPFSLVSPLLIGVGAFVALRCVWRWESTRVVVTRDRLLVSTGILRHREAAVRLSKMGTLEVEQTVLGRLLGYGTLVAGELEVSCVPQPRELCRLVERLAD
jgi:membrane protein YdbS with pleckstrin-like domain